MMETSADVYTVGLSMLSAAVDAQSEKRAIVDVDAIAADLTAPELRALVTYLAVESIWHVRPRRSKSAVREWIEMRRFAVIARSMKAEDV